MSIKHQHTNLSCDLVGDHNVVYSPVRENPVVVVADCEGSNQAQVLVLKNFCYNIYKQNSTLNESGAV